MGTPYVAGHGMKNRGLTPVLVVAALLAFPALAQTWPAKPVRLIVSTAVGTTPDLVTRLVADRLQKSTGQAFFIENITGANGMLASQAAARAAPDGYTFYHAGVGVMATDRYLFKTLSYDPDKSFVPVAILYDAGALGIGVLPSLPVRTVPELIAYAKANPGKLSYGTQPVGVIPLFGKWFTKVTDTDMVAIPYKTQPQMLQDLFAGLTQLIFYSVNTMEPLHRHGKLRVIGIANPSRYAPLPDVPTVAETLPGFDIAGIGILVAPAGIPAELVQRVNRTVDPAIRDPDYVQKLQAVGISANTNNIGAGTVAEVNEFVRVKRANWDRIMKEVKIEMQ
jgi:tripartite-type tricarboxylate transporter receptor subunit TctC